MIRPIADRSRLNVPINAQSSDILSEPIITEKPRTRCAVFVPLIGRGGPRKPITDPDAPTGSGKRQPFRAPQAQLEEAVGLAAAIDLDIVLTDISRVPNFKPATLFGGGKVEELKQAMTENAVDLVMVDHPLTPVQQRNLERAWQVKVLDRTGMILEIFGARAQTKEGRLQVELAALSYQRGRLVRSWTHLERQRGGGGFLGGPGETQIESDRRALQNKIERLERQLEEVRRTRALHRKQRVKQEIPVIAFVGYTNAGKSTLFNRITNADVLAENLLFATLDPTLRKMTLGEGTEVVFSDTVGFISKLPTDLVAAFRATLEEVTTADIIVHVRDFAHPDTRAQAEDVLSVLADLEVDVSSPERLNADNRHYFEVWNKVDLLTADEREKMDDQLDDRDFPPIFPISAMTGEGVDRLLSALEKSVNEGQTVRKMTIEGAALSNLHRLYALGTVLDRQVTDEGAVVIKIRSERWPEIDRIFKA